MKNTHISFYCENAFSLIYALPIIKDYLDKNYKVDAFVEQKLFDVVGDNPEMSNINFIIIDKFKNFFLAKLTEFFKLFFINDDFSPLYFQRKKIKFGGGKLYFFSNFFKFFKIKNNRVNSFYRKVFSKIYSTNLFKKLPVNSSKIYVLTKVFHPYLLSPYNKITHLITESWDHPAKEPFLIDPNVSESWNTALSNELKKYQGYKKITKSRCLKFNYITELNNKQFDIELNKNDEADLKNLENIDYAIYPMFTSSKYFAFEDEVVFVSDLAKKMSADNIKLYIRPYPLAPIEDVEKLKKIFNVIVGCGNILENGFEVFDKSHMLHKYLLIKKAKYVINLGTTFVFDAAIVKSNCKIIQLKIESDSYGNLGTYAHGVHMKNYLHNGLEMNFNEFALKDANFDYKKYLLEWLNDIYECIS